jgi:exodeoxyribonuclease VII large subunit
LYEARGDFQLTVEFVQKAGLGALFEAFEKLKAKLSHEGLFDPRFKRAIPTHPKAIGIVTSPDAAALRDVLTTLKRRNPNIPVIIYPTPVQGKGAAALIAQAIHTANVRQEVDTLIICRGGGSLEDLWSFNEEIVARAIDECTIPTMSGVGHETDVTIADFVADLRAATPTAAAEQACLDLSQLKVRLEQLAMMLQKRMESDLNRHAQRLDFLSRCLISPLQRIAHETQQLKQWQHRLQSSMHQHLQTQTAKMLRLTSSLEQLNPRNVLARGYAMVQNKQGDIITQAQQLSARQAITVTLQHGAVEAEVVHIKD